MSEQDQTFNVLFLCTGNSARSIMAEVYLNAKANGRFRAYSAGSHPNGTVNPHAIELLSSIKLPVSDLRSKSWDVFALPDAPHMDFIITVCDNAAGEVCPIWPGHPTNAHWPFEDPASFVGSPDAIRKKFSDVFIQIRRRIDLFVELPWRSLDKTAIKQSIKTLGAHDASHAT